MGEKKSSRNQTSRKERKAKKRAAEDMIPDIPEPEPALSSITNEEVEERLDKKPNITAEASGKKRKRSGEDEEGGADEKGKDPMETQRVNREKKNEESKKKSKRSKKSVNKESKICDEVDNSCELEMRDIAANHEEAEAEENPLSLVKKDGEKKRKEKRKKDKTQSSSFTTDVLTGSSEENSAATLEKDSILLKKSKKERKAELKAASTQKLDLGSSSRNDDSQKKKSEATIDKNKNKKLETNTVNKDASNGEFEDDAPTINATGMTTTTATDAAMKEKKTSKTKKDKKKKKSQEQQQQQQASPTSTLDTSSCKIAAQPSENGVADQSSTNGTAKSGGARFIVFVGNLPYTTTTASIMAHFSKLKPRSVRHLTKKEDPSKSRGIAFVEFENYDTHKTALKIMHHSIFDDGKSEPRMINVELTAGGGGNTDDRKAKIKIKNERLTEQRARRIEEEEKAKLRKEEEKTKVDKVPLSDSAQSSSENNIHPSRRRMISA